MVILCFTLFYAGEPDMSQKIILALKLSSIVHGTTIDDGGRREVPPVPQNSNAGPDHEIWQRSSEFCEHQEVCKEKKPDSIFTQPGKIVIYQCQGIVSGYNFV